MARQKSAQRERQGMSGMERLNVRVSSMINHPVAQERREVKIHRLDTDGDREWRELLGALSEADGIAMTHSDEEEAVTLRWEPSEDDEDRALSLAEIERMEPEEEVAPF